MNASHLLIALLSSSSLFLSGCASIVSKSDWPVTFKSNPTGSEIVIRDGDGNEIQRGVTPTTLTLHASKGYMKAATYDFEVTHAGYNPAKGSVTAGVNGWLYGNIVFGGLIGILVVDPLTGAAYKLPPEASVDLLPIRTTTESESPSLTVLSMNEIPLVLRSRLERLN